MSEAHFRFEMMLQRGTSDSSARHHVLEQLVLLGSVLRTWMEKTERDVLCGYISRLCSRIEMLNKCSQSAAEIETEFGEFVELLYDYRLTCAGA